MRYYSLQELFCGSVSELGLSGPLVCFMPWPLWRRFALELGLLGACVRMGVVADHLGNVFVAHDGPSVVVHDVTAAHVLDASGL